MRADAAAVGQKDGTCPACSQHRQPLSPSLFPRQLQMPQLRQVPKTHFSNPVLPQMQTSVRLQVKSGLQDTARSQLQDQHGTSRESAQISPYPHLIATFPASEPAHEVWDQRSSPELREQCELLAP